MLLITSIAFPVFLPIFAVLKQTNNIFESHSKISKMFDIYDEECEKNSNPQTTSQHLYRDIFNNEFNGFHLPKSDRCDACEEMKIRRQ